jgi:hypothetical protein
LIAKNRTLRFTRADALNDAFELSPFIVPLNWLEITELAKTNLPAAKALSNEAFRRICASLYITCFSRSCSSPESQLMWAHYGDSHKGVAIEVDFEFLRKQDPGCGYFPVGVTYVNSLLEERNRRSPASEDLALFIATYKDRVWAYEDEVRVVIETESFDKARFKPVPGDRYVDVNFNPAGIRKVVFGLKSDPREIHEVMADFLPTGHSPEFVRLDLDPLTLKVLEKPIPRVC